MFARVSLIFSVLIHIMDNEQKRYVIMRFGRGWIIWDNHKNRIADGVYYHDTGKEMVLATAEAANKDWQMLDREWERELGPFNDALRVDAATYPTVQSRNDD